MHPGLGLLQLTFWGVLAASAVFFLHSLHELHQQEHAQQLYAGAAQHCQQADSVRDAECASRLRRFLLQLLQLFMIRGARLGCTSAAVGSPICLTGSLKMFDARTAGRSRLVQRLLDEAEPTLQELRRMPPGPERKCGPSLHSNVCTSMHDIKSAPYVVHAAKLGLSSVRRCSSRTRQFGGCPGLHLCCFP